LRREAEDAEALQRMRSDSGEGRTFTREALAEAWGISAACFRAGRIVTQRAGFR